MTRLKMALQAFWRNSFPVPALVDNASNGDGGIADGKNQHMLTRVEGDIAFRQIIPILSDTGIFCQKFHRVIEHLQVNIHLRRAVGAECVLGNIPQIVLGRGGDFKLEREGHQCCYKVGLSLLFG